MSYDWTFGKKLAGEFQNFPIDQKQSIAAFIVLYEAHGLSDFTKYEGKISPSWSGVPETDVAHAYAKANHLWHYHIGIPTYTSVHPKYKTSDMVLHFQWPDRGSHINLADVYYHHKSDGEFYLPPPDYLV